MSLIVVQMLEKHKEAQAQSLAELQQELKSLKTLLLNRGPSVSVSGPSTPSPLPVFPGRPSIPAWQLPGGEASGTSSPSNVPGSESKTPDITDAVGSLNGVNNDVTS
jgi:peroxin-14